MKFVEASPGGEFVVSSFPYILDFDIRIWTRKLEFVAVFKGHKCFVNRVAWSPCGKYLASCAEDYTVIIWTFTREKCLILYKRYCTKSPRSLEWTDKRTLFVLCNEQISCMKIKDRGSGIHLINVKNAVIDSEENFSGIVYCTDSKTLYVWSASSIIRVDPETMYFHYLPLDQLFPQDTEWFKHISSISPIDSETIVVANATSIYLLNIADTPYILRSYDFEHEVFRTSANPNRTCIIVNFVPMSQSSHIVYIKTNVNTAPKLDIDHAGDFSWLDDNHVAFDYGNSLRIVKFRTIKWKSQDSEKEKEEEKYFSVRKIMRLQITREICKEENSYMYKLPEDCIDVLLESIMGSRIDFRYSETLAFC